LTNLLILWRPFLARWYSNLKDRISGWNHVSILVTVVFSIIGGALLAFQSTKSIGQLFIAVMAIFALIAFVVEICKSFPVVFLSFHNKVGGSVSLEELENFLQKPKFIGVIGRQNVGKTTFVDACVGRKYENQSTDKPYARIVALPNTSPTKYVALIDTVGSSDSSQFRIQSMSDSLVLFLDHSESTNSNRHSKERLKNHEYLVNQLIKAHDHNARQTKVAIFCNKSELWSSRLVDSSAMDELAGKIRTTLMQSGKYQVVETINRHSNTETKDIAFAMSRLGQL
jgi:GTPase SAR1 family protein